MVGVQGVMTVSSMMVEVSGRDVKVGCKSKDVMMGV